MRKSKLPKLVKWYNEHLVFSANTTIINKAVKMFVNEYITPKNDKEFLCMSKTDPTKMYHIYLDTSVLKSFCECKYMNPDQIDLEKSDYTNFRVCSHILASSIYKKTLSLKHKL